ncbi:IS630 family transposase [Verminephrobacter eiseniae]|uniref:IS630 family transposase n=2 Tax=Verminephrobacter eiseniae TaxID=364317 RepID=UPI002238C960|nr:IS630 family transposase [Verminephrobacter eiseniae]MCW5230231.1 IS630 family transposase [Verminephrobacter eiseniae]MCW5291964.1 IS630 family transposase [Verminephrobacter eiseniae]
MQRMGKMNLTDAERDKLLSATRSRTARVADVRRAKLILMLEEGQSRDTIMQRLECDSRFISRWSSRFLSERLAGMYARHPGRAPKQPPAKLEARVLNYTLRRKPSDGSTHWSSYKLSAELGDVSVSAVQRIWRKHNVRPQRLDRHMVSNDPDFETKAADVIGLYLNPPAHAVVFCVDEKTAIQALDRQDRMLPLSPGRAESHGFEYKRNGTLSLFAALNTATGQVLGKTAARHTSEQFVAFLTDIVASQCERQEIHVICGNVSSHKTQRVRDFLVRHGNVRMHFTPTYSSWLNQVENWFSRIQRDVITRGVFTSVKDLGRKLMRYIREHHKNPKPIKWEYDDPSRRIRQVLIQ